MDALARENADLRARQAYDRRQRLDKEVAARVPDFREVDRDPRWHAWLRGIDPMSGRVRQTLLNEAIASGNANQVHWVFHEFKRQAGASTGSTSSPSRRGAPGKPIYTNDSIKQLYEAHRRGAYAGREDAWARQEADIFQAMKEGRVHARPFLTK
jgi:hypothetical protein